MESPVTETLLSSAEDHIEYIGECLKRGVYTPGDPQRTQEAIVRLMGNMESWEDLVSILRGDWEIFDEVEEEEESEDGEYERDNPAI